MTRGNNKYDGEWEKGKPHGLGCMTYPNGDVFKGNWIQGQWSGPGTCIFSNGDIYHAYWRWDYIVPKIDIINKF